MSLPPLARLQAPPLPSALPPLAVSLAPPEAAKLAAQFQALPSATLSPAAGGPLPSLPASVPVTVVASTPLPATEGSGVQLTLKLPDGTQLQARSPTPVPVGSTLQLPPPPAPNLVSAPVLPNPASPIILRALLQPLTSPAAAIPAPALPSTPALVGSAQPNLPILTLTSLSPNPAPQVLYPRTQPIPGPLPLQIPTNIPTNWASQPLTLTLQTSIQGQLQPVPPATPTNAPRPLPIPVQLAVPLNLPLRTEIPLIIPNLQNKTPLGLEYIPIKQEILNTLGLIITTAAPSPSLASPSMPPAASPLLNALRLLIPPATPAGQQLARVLPPTPQTPPGLQPVLLASGEVAQLEVTDPEIGTKTQVPTAPLSPPLTAGTVLRVNIPTVGGPAQILQMHSHQPQLLPPNQGQASPPVSAPQTPQAVLAPGSVVTGTITGQNAQGQPLLTLTSPGPLAGQSFALSLGTGQAANTPLAATLVVGAKVQVQITPDGGAQLLSLELPPAAARATTLASLGARWESLEQTLNQLQTSNPAAAAQARANLPLISNLLPGLMRLLEGIREQNPGKILGPEAAQLARALGSDLSPDLAQLQQLLAKPAEDPTQWRGFILPYLENPEGQPQQGSFFFRREAEDDPRSPTTTRFVAELSLSQLGPLQLDGLVNYPEIWLKLRSQRSLPAGFVEGLQALVAPLLAGLNLAGGISTETVTSFPLNPAADLRAAAETALGVSS